MDPTIFLEHRCVFCNRRLLISKTWHNNTDNHEKETEKQKLNFPLVAHTLLTRPWRWLSTLQIKQQGGNTCFKETAPESKTRSAISCFHFCLWESPSLLAASLWNTAITAESICEHYHSVTGHPETEGNSLRMQWLCCFVDIILEFTWGNVRENHNIILLLRRGGAGGRDWQWFNLGVLQTILWKKIQIKNSPTEQNSTVQFSLILRNTTVMMCSW